MNDRIKLAESIGWKWHPAAGRPNDDMGRWEFKGMFLDWSTKANLPFDPFTDANDCNALIIHLLKLGYFIEIKLNPDDVAAKASWMRAEIEASDPNANGCFNWTGDDWKQGVCELALKVLDDD